MTKTWGITGRGLTRVVLGAAVVLLTASSTALAVPNHEVTIGANLKTAPNVTFDCSVIPFEFSSFGTGGPSCAWGNPTVPGTTEGGLGVPGTGTIYKVRLRVGATTGRMQLVILRWLVDPNDPVNNQCCAFVARSSIFTPVRNGITTLNVKLPVKLAPQGGIVVFDTVGLQILEDKVAIPVINETNLPIQNQPVDTFNAPAFTTLGAFQNHSDPAGYRLDMQAQWYPPGQHPPGR